MAGIFPNLDTSNKTFHQVNLNAEAERALKGKNITESPYLDPLKAQKLVDRFHKRQGSNCTGSYGGFGEWRGTIWKGSYLEETQGFTHLGTDYNVPAGTEVAFTWEVKILDIYFDQDEKIGWGGRICAHMLNRPLVIVFAHLNPEDIRCDVDDQVKPGQIVGTVGIPPSNGNTFEHLHVQMMRLNQLNQFLNGGDGYGQPSELRRYLDPESYAYDLLGRGSTRPSRKRR